MASSMRIPSRSLSALAGLVFAAALAPGCASRPAAHGGGDAGGFRGAWAPADIEGDLDVSGSQTLST